MKRFFCFIAALVSMVAAFAQTPEEIIARMDTELEQYGDLEDGLFMIVDLKVPIVGTVSTKTYIKGDKARMEASMSGKQIITWTDGQTDWTYSSDDNTIKIEKAKASSSEPGDDMELFNNITDGYKASLTKETADAWYFRLKKTKENKSKDDPKTMDLVVAKGTYLPKSLSAKMSGVTLTMRDFVFGVDDETVTFHPEKYPNAKIVDER